MFSPLAVYEEIRDRTGITDYGLYSTFSRYTLSAQDLVENDYPLESPDRKGHIVIKPKPYTCDPSSRVCCRCYVQFCVEKEYLDSTQTNCLYHTGYMKLGRYSCCDMPISSGGCSSAQWHVTTETEWEDVVFRRVNGKRLLKNEQSCKVYSLDCEMVFTTKGLELAKIGLVDIQGKPVYVSFVRPEHPVVDYNTKYSGVSASDLKGVIVSLADVQSFLLRTLNRNTILIGHALQNDLKVLRLMHDNVIDTQVVFRNGGNIRHREKLKSLARKYLEKTIHESMFGHDPVEDARVCMELMLSRIRYNSLSSMNESIKENLYTVEDHNKRRSQQPWERCRQVCRPDGLYTTEMC